MEKKPIDFVLIWVDGNDPAWIAQKNEYLNMPQQRADIESGAIDAGSSRYRDWDNLQYWFRAVEKYAPWVNKIHFVTWGHLPKWLNTAHPKLNVVRHEDFIPAEYLPTFSANPIENNLHRIKGLAEQFVYFNDDVFLTAPVAESDFFVDGLPCDSLSEAPLTCSGEIFSHIQLNVMAVVNRHFSRRETRREIRGKWYSFKNYKALARNLIYTLVPRDDFFGLTVHHLTQAYLKSTLEEVWELEPELLHQTSTHRFRHFRDVNQYVFKYYQLLNGRFHSYNIEGNGKSFHDAWDPREAVQVIEKGKFKIICLNDSSQLDFEAARVATTEAFEKVFPEKSGFEL